MAYLDKVSGIQPSVRKELALRDKAMSGDIVMVITPATVDRVATALAFTRTVKISIKTASGEVHKFLNGSYATTLSIADTSTAGTATIASTTLTLVNGEAIVTITGSANAWLSTETNTLTVGNITILGKTVTGGTSVETIVVA